jgi:hypothetical protein
MTEQWAIAAAQRQAHRGAGILTRQKGEQRPSNYGRRRRTREAGQELPNEAHFEQLAEIVTEEMTRNG